MECNHTHAQMYIFPLALDSMRSRVSADLSICIVRIAFSTLCLYRLPCVNGHETRTHLTQFEIR